MNTNKKTYVTPRLQSFALESAGPLAGSSTLNKTDENVDKSEKSSKYGYSPIWGDSPIYGGIVPFMVIPFLNNLTQF